MSDPTDAGRPHGAIPRANRAALSMRRRARRGYLTLRGQAEQSAFVAAVRAVCGIAPPTTPDTAIDNEGMAFIRLASNEWLLTARVETVATVRRELRAYLHGLFATVADVSDDFATIEITGDEAWSLIVRASDGQLGAGPPVPGHWVRRTLAGQRVLIVATADMPGFQLIVQSDSVPELWQWLDTASREVSARPD